MTTNYYAAPSNTVVEAETTKRERAYLFNTRDAEPVGRVESIDWDLSIPGMAVTGTMHMQVATTKNHKRIKIGQIMCIVTPDDTWHTVMIQGIRSRGGNVSCQSSECAGRVDFIVTAETTAGRPKQFRRGIIPVGRPPKFTTPEEAEAWLDEQAAR